MPWKSTAQSRPRKSLSQQKDGPVREQISVIGQQEFNGVIYTGEKIQFQTLQHDTINPFVQFTGKEIPLQ